MTLDQQNAERMGRALAGAIHEHWGLFLAEGIILVLLGIAAIVLPPIATLAFTIIIGWVFLISRRRRLVHHILGAAVPLASGGR